MVHMMRHGRVPESLEDFVDDTRYRKRVTSVFERFAVFADQWTAWVPGEPSLIGDMRFGIDGRFSPPWAQRLGRKPGEPPIAWEQLVPVYGRLNDAAKAAQAQANAARLKAAGK